MAKMWGGRFKKGLDQDAQKLSYSLQYDAKLAKYDILVNKAHSRALYQAQVLTKSELQKINLFLTKLLKEITDQKFDFSAHSEEDIHGLIESLVTDALGDLGKKMHTGKSRNDQVVTDLRLYLKEQIQVTLNHLDMVLKALYKLAQEHVHTIFPGCTHFQTAQPVVLAHHLLAYFEKFSRDKQRFLQAFESTDVCPLGSAALAGNNYGLDRELVAHELGFSKISANSMDAISDRDFVLEYTGAASICMTHLSRICEELVLWNSPLIDFIRIGDEFTTGSSIMPQKKNPDIAELIRGKSARIVGAHFSELHLLKSLPLTYNRDLQEDKEPLFDVVENLNMSLLCFAKMIKSLEFKKENIFKALQKGAILATEIADYLVKKGLPFRDAHEIVGQIVQVVEQKNIRLEEFALTEFQTYSPLFQKDIYEVLTYEGAVAAKDVYGGTAPQRVEEQLRSIKKKL
jgi:argininosuccinate lyase